MLLGVSLSPHSWSSPAAVASANSGPSHGDRIEFMGRHVVRRRQVAYDSLRRLHLDTVALQVLHDTFGADTVHFVG